jgi:hypothetical protein
MLKIRFYRELCGKVIKPLFFRFYWELCGKRLRVFSPRCGVFVTQGAQSLRKGRKGFASFAKSADFPQYNSNSKRRDCTFPVITGDFSDISKTLRRAVNKPID